MKAPLKQAELNQNQLLAHTGLRKFTTSFIEQ
jgi:hypothetical protein